MLLLLLVHAPHFEEHCLIALLPLEHWRRLKHSTGNYWRRVNILKPALYSCPVCVLPRGTWMKGMGIEFQVH